MQKIKTSLMRVRLNPLCSCLALLALVAVSVSAQGTADATVTAAADDAKATFDYVVGVMIAIVVALIGIRFLRRVR